MEWSIETDILEFIISRGLFYGFTAQVIIIIQPNRQLILKLHHYTIQL